MLQIWDVQLGNHSASFCGLCRQVATEALLLNSVFVIINAMKTNYAGGTHILVLCSFWIIEAN